MNFNNNNNNLCRKCNSFARVKNMKIDSLQPDFYFDKEFNEHMHEKSMHIDLIICGSCGLKEIRKFRNKCPNCNYGGEIIWESY